MKLQALPNALNQDSFTKEQVKRRLRAQAVALWNLQEADADNLDPVIDLLMGACAVEFERTAHQVYASQARILERLAELMVPEVTTSARPAHAIMHACSELPSTIVKKENTFSAEKEVLQGNKTVVLPISLSPATDFTLFDATIICQATKNKIAFYDTPLVKGDSLYAAHEETAYNTSLWLGIRINNKIQSLQGFSFFFDWKNNPDKAKFVPLLSLTDWVTEGNDVLKTHGGYPKNGNDARRQMIENDMIKPFENHALQVYQNQFVSIQSQSFPLVYSTYPSAFRNIFTDEVLKSFKDDLLWVEVRFPEGISLQAIDDVYCSLNCFPVMNRKHHAGNRPYSLSPNLNIIPLLIDEHFMSVSRVYTASREYQAVSVDKRREMEDGIYSVKQSGVSRFDQRDAEALLHYLYELMRDESGTFKAFGNYALNSEIKGLEQSLTRLKMHFINKPLHQSTKCHLFLNTKLSEDVWVEFWTSQGEAANLLAAGTKTKPLSPANVKRTTLMLMTPTSGGREPLNESEKVHAFRFALLTRSRIATEEDLKAACFSELGDKLKNVEIKKGFKKELSSRSGFVKTLDILLTPAVGFESMDWNATCNELRSYIERNKLFLTQIQVLTTNSHEYVTR
ncbi:type VI secretion system baseplate subunit TssF [Pontibacter saemangeumensis]|uniref:Type VI secretion system baseplate subunit TssF n=1 Tax=Pontibacter saemangeumensis TaxID=1084525 RepID=A0ABP8M0V0_9BACT